MTFLVCRLWGLSQCIGTATNIINDKHHNLQTSYMTNIISDICCLCQIIMFVALLGLLHYDLCRLQYCVCRLVTFVALLCLSHYYVCCIIMFVAYEVCLIMMFVTNYDVCC